MALARQIGERLPPIANAMQGLGNASAFERTSQEECVVFVILDLLLQGLPTSVIARRFGLTVRGVKFHVENIKAKYGVKTRLQLPARFV